MLCRDNFDVPEVTQPMCDGRRTRIHPLALSFSLAAALAALAAFAGAGLWASLLVFWLGGAAIVFPLAMISTGRKPSITRMDQSRADVVFPDILHLACLP
jgi:hypothetical protein